MKLIWKYLRNHKKILWLALLLTVFNQGFSLLDPQIFRLIVDNYATKASTYASHEFITGVGLLLLIAVGAAFLSRLAKNFQDYYVNVITQRMGTDMYARSVEHSFSLSYGVFEDQRSGELLQKLQKARADAERLVESMINILFLSLVGAVFVIIYAFYVHWSIGILYFSLIPIIGVVTYFISGRIKEAQRKIVLEKADLAGTTTETLRNVELVKSLGLEKQEIQRLNKVNNAILQLELEKVKLVRKMSFTQGTVVNLLRSSLLFLMFWLIFKQAISIGEFFTLFVYSFFIFTPLQQLGALVSQYQESRASSEELQKVLDLRPEPKAALAQNIRHIEMIEFKNVGFQYQSADQLSISDISLQIKSGQTVAFVGPTGSGKSTILKLIAGLYQPTKGQITFNNIDSTKVDFESLRKNIGLVSQETQLFAGSLKDNLLFVKPEATDVECRTVLERAQVAALLERGDQGLETKIGEGGIKISGGERQRLAIARALLRQPDLIIFDEATSSLDSITEAAITETIRRIEKERPQLLTILVAHRLSTVKHADRIFVLENGKLIEQGSHDFLLKKQGLYAALWRQQSGFLK